MEHLQYSIELNGKCPECGTPPVLLTCEDLWRADEEPYEADERLEDVTEPQLKQWAEELLSGVELGIEISIHYCPQCQKIISLCINW